MKLLKAFGTACAVFAGVVLFAVVMLFLGGLMYWWPPVMAPVVFIVVLTAMIYWAEVI